MFLEISQNSQDNTCVRVSFLIKLQASGNCPDNCSRRKLPHKITSFYFYQSKLGFGIFFCNCQSCKCGQLSNNPKKRDLGDPNFSFTTIVIPIVISRITDVHLKNLWVYIFTHIHTHTSIKSLSGDFQICYLIP